MNIVTCIKPVRAEFVDANLKEKYTINPYDLYALKKGIELKTKYGYEVICVSMGAEIEDVLKKCYALGADKVIWLKDSRFAGSDTVSTSMILADFISNSLEYEIIMCGENAVDGETGQVPPGLAERLNLRFVFGVRDVIEVTDSHVILKTLTDRNENMIKVKRPVLIAFGEFEVDRGDISLISLKRAQNKCIDIYTADDILLKSENYGLDGSKTKVLNSVSCLEKKVAVRIIRDQDKEAQLIKKLTIG